MKLQITDELLSFAADIEALDVSDENEVIAAIEAEIAEINGNISRAEGRLSEIMRATGRNFGRDAEAVADALQAGADVMEAATMAPNIDELKSEGAALRSGLGVLRDRIREKRKAIEEIEHGVEARIADLAKPLIAAIEREEKAAAAIFKESYAAIATINLVTRRFTIAQMATKEVLKGLMGMNKLLKHERDIEVPKPLLDALAPLASKGKACRSKPTGVHRWN